MNDAETRRQLNMERRMREWDELRFNRRSSALLPVITMVLISFLLMALYGVLQWTDRKYWNSVSRSWKKSLVNASHRLIF